MVYIPMTETELNEHIKTWEPVTHTRRNTIAYVAGPYAGKGRFGIVRWFRQWRNILRARKVAYALWSRGYTVICPHTNTAWMDKACSRDWFLKGDLEILDRCDVMVLLPGWRNSEGTMGELKYAFDHGIEVFNSVDALDKWTREVQE